MNTIQTGISILDKQLSGGLRGGSLTVIAARPGMGKTSLALQIAGNIVNSGSCVFFFTLEMTKDSVKTQMKKQGYESPGNNMIVYDEPNISVEYIMQKATGSEKVDAIFVDYITLMRGRINKLVSGKKEVEEIVGDLKYLAEKLDVPIVVVSQLSRTVDGVTDRLLLVDSVKKAGFREQDTDVIIIPYRESYYLKYPDNNEKDWLIVGQNKYGEIGSIPVHWNEEKLIFED